MVSGLDDTRFFELVESMENVELVRAKLALDVLFEDNFDRTLLGSVLREARSDVDLMTTGATVRIPLRERKVDGFTPVPPEMVTRLACTAFVSVFGVTRPLRFNADDVVVVLTIAPLLPVRLGVLAAAMRSAIDGLRYELRTATRT